MDDEAIGMTDAPHSSSVLMWIYGDPLWHNRFLNYCYLPETEKEHSARNRMRELERGRLCAMITGMVIDSERLSVSAAEMPGNLVEFTVLLAPEDRNPVVQRIREPARALLQLASWTGQLFRIRITEVPIEP